MIASDTKTPTKKKKPATKQTAPAKPTHKGRIVSKYDATESNRERRQASRETKSEAGIYDSTKRLLGCNLGRDLERNYSPAKAMLHQIKVNVVGSLGKIRVNVENGEEATAWFNEEWSKDCDYRDELDWSTELQLTLGAFVREGDSLLVFDDDVIEDSGKLVTWESDQIVPVADDLFKVNPLNAQKQDNGILRNEFGRVIGYSVTGKHGLSVISDKEDVTYFKREDARLAVNPWRFNQGRGVPMLLTPSTNIVDLYEILASSLMSAKRAAKQYSYVKRENAVVDWDDPNSAPEYLPENDGRTSAEVATDGANQSTHTARNYEMLEALTGGLTDYIDPSDSIEIPDIKHPNPDLAPFLETVIGYCGSALGLARAYTILRADSSYTSFRGDMIMTWVTFYWLQKMLERRVCDWVGRKALTWAQRKKVIKPLPDKWERTLSWDWPRMPEVDELDAQNAISAALKNGTTDFATLLGPDWEKRMEAYAKQIKKVRELLLPLSVLELKSGGQAQNPKKDNAQKTEGE